MDGQKLLDQISGMLKAELGEFREEMNRRFAEQDQRVDQRLAEQNREIAGLFREQSQELSRQLTVITTRLDAMENQIKSVYLDIENQVTANLKALGDGYDQVFDKTADHEKRITALEDRRLAG